METDLIFTQGVDLPGFASYPLLETEDGRALLQSYYEALMRLAKDHKTGVILESLTWVANRDRAASIGYNPQQVVHFNREAVALMCQLRETFGDLPTLVSANIGPRDDAYMPSDQMDAEEAQTYHSEQIGVLAETDVDVISGYTLAYPAEAIGIVKAAQHVNLPVVIAFTVETDGKLPTGMSLSDAIETVDHETGGYADYFMINCAHPDHFSAVLENTAWMKRIGGIVANASRCSHAELDNATELDAGDPVELGHQLVTLRKRFPHLSVLGGCCGTDMRHLKAICSAL